MTWISFHGNPKTRLLNSQFPAPLTKVYLLRTQRSNCMVVIIKNPSLLKTQYINTESFPQNLLLFQATLTKMQEFKFKLFTIQLLQDRLSTLVAYFHTAKHTSIKILFTKKTTHQPKKPIQSTWHLPLFKFDSKFKQKYYIYLFVNSFHCNTLVD